MSYTKCQFGMDLKNKLSETKRAEDIAKWTYEIFLENGRNLEDGLHEILLTLNLMEEGPEFSYSYEELNKIADDLIANRKIDFK